MTTFLLITSFLTSILSMVLAFSTNTVSTRRRSLVSVANVVNGAVGTHAGTVTRFADGPITARYLLGKKGSGGDNSVALCTAADAPLYVILDEAEAADDPVACDIPGALGRTTRVTAAGAISVGAEVVAAAAGKAQALPASPGTYYSIGRALTPAEANGDLVEIAAHSARTITVN